jgi:hypothetical protein
MKPSLDSENSTRAFGAYARYSALAIQAGVIIFAGTFGGLRLDQYLHLRFPVFTVILSLVSVFSAIWLLVREVIKKDKKQ